MRITILPPALGKLTGHTTKQFPRPHTSPWFFSVCTHAMCFSLVSIENISICHFVLAIPDSPTEYEVSCSVSSQIASDHRIVQCENRNRELQRFYLCDPLVQSMQQLSTAIAKIAQCIPCLKVGKIKR